MIYDNEFFIDFALFALLNQSAAICVNWWLQHEWIFLNTASELDLFLGLESDIEQVVLIIILVFLLTLIF
jgi:hypothetical protein